MKIAYHGRFPTILSQTVNLGNSYRYISTNPDLGFQTVSFWVGRGLEHLNYCGQGYDGFNCAMIPCSAFSYSGEMTRIKVGMSVFVSDPRIHTFRWGVAIFRSDNSYLGWQPTNAVGLLDQGTFTLDYNNRAISFQEFEFPANVPSGMPFYIYLWRNSTSYGNIHITSNFTVSATIAARALQYRDATPYIWHNGEWKLATAKVYDGGWKTGG